jgi:hypothetical protein
MRSLAFLLLLTTTSHETPTTAFVAKDVPRTSRSNKSTSLHATKDPSKITMLERRDVVQQLLLTVVPVITGGAKSASAASFTAGGTLVDREVGVQVGNPEASPSRKPDNSNVIFDKDHYFKFGVAAPWIAPGSTEFPKSMPFTPSQQRYDALKKYGSRVKNGVQFLQGLEDGLKASTDDFASAIPDPSSTPEYALRPMGLLANSFLASENTGTTNELFLSRWYINEIYLLLGDTRSASNKDDAMKSYAVAKKALNSYLGLMNRVITSKVGDPFELVPV